MGRVMSIIGVPMLLVPIFGPLIGGALIDAGSWRLIFFVNLPVGLVAVALAVRLLPATAPRPGQHLDISGAALLSGGLALFLYGLVHAGAHAQVATAGDLVPMAIGAILVGLFVRHALRVANPLIDVRLFRQRGFATGAAANLVLGTALFGVALLLPLYFEILRGRSPFSTGLLMAPQGLGAAMSISLAGYLTDKVGARRVVPVGIAIAAVGTAWYARVGARTRPTGHCWLRCSSSAPAWAPRSPRPWPPLSKVCLMPLWARPPVPSMSSNAWLAPSGRHC